ncbi:F-box protein CPR1-like [Silene latifolia]|uniref:F-box protein CPR1-like n=1 Tax=Silene latifolia TaxID=37657 RepID=UPI003D7726D2
MDVSFKPIKPSSLVTLPMEIIFSCILPKLPAKSLLRFKSVSKSFLTEISSPKFNASFSEANHGLLILPGKNQTFLIYELDSLCSPPTLFPYPIPSTWHDPLATIAACCESYLLIGCEYNRDSSLVLVNPTTHIFRIIPNVYVGGGLVQYGMCHCLDEFNNDDFKIVRFHQYNDPNTDDTMREVSVYSLRSNSWTVRESKIATTESIWDLVLVKNHLLVMICYSSGRITRIGCFDIKAERWSNDVVLSDTLLGEIGLNPARYHDHYRLCLLDGCLCFTCYDVNKWTNSIWVMKEYGVKESWFKFTSLPVQGPQHVFYHPIAYRKGSSHELLCLPTYGGKYLWYNLREKQFTETGLEGVHLCFAYIHKETLLNFPGGQPIHSISKEPEKEEKEDEYNYIDYGFEL